MSSSAFTIDDLVLSLSGNHIGEDAINLKALQAQLAETLYSHTVNSSGRQIPRRNSDLSQPCNTPTTKTPSSSSFPFGSMEPQPTAGGRPASLGLRIDSLVPSIDEDLDDEAMVEDILMDCSSPPTNAHPSTARRPFSSSHYSHSPSDAGPSLFTTCDPFYMQMVEQPPPSSQSRTPSVFAQAGMPCHQSPFIRGGAGVGVGGTGQPTFQFQTASFGRRDNMSSSSHHHKAQASNSQALWGSPFDM